MRKLCIILAFFTIAFSACNEEKIAEIRFCSDIRANDPCIGEDTVFIKGTNIWAQLWFKPGFEDSLVTGSLYGYEDGRRVFIESMVHQVSEGQQVIMEAMFFNSSGNFEVEFTDSKGNLLDKKGFEVW